MNMSRLLVGYISGMMKTPDPGRRPSGYHSGGIDEPKFLTDAVDGVHGVVLAAGLGRRFGQEKKLLAMMDGRPIVRAAIESLLGVGLAGITVVLGHEHDRITPVLADLPVEIRLNPDYRHGMHTSVAMAVAAARDAGANGVLISLGDMPYVRRESVVSLLTAYHSGKATALAAAVDGSRGNPTLFDSYHFDSLESVEGDIGGRELFAQADDAVLVETGDPGVKQDVDYPSNL